MINLNSLRSSHRRFLQAHDRAVWQSLDESRKDGIEHVQRNPGFKPRTGELQRATTGQVIRTSRGSVVRLENRKPHARPIDKGARPHVIRARGGGYLAFRGRGGGMVFRKSVNHPGNRPYHFLRTASTAAARSFELGMSARMRTIARSF